MTVATLVFMDIFVVTGRGPIIVTDSVDNRNFQLGQFANLAPLGINKHLPIKGVEFTLIRRNGVAKDYPSLLLPDLSEEDLNWLKNRKPKGVSFEVLQEGWLT